MITWWKRFWRRFLREPAYFVATLRAVASTSGLALAFFGEKLASLLGQGSKAALGFQIAGVAAAGLSLLLRAGDKNLGDDALREQLKRLGVSLPALDAPPPRPPPGAGFVDWRLAAALLVALGLIGLGVWDPWGWGLVDAALLLGAGCIVGAWFTSHESSNGWYLGEEWGAAEILALVGACLFLAALVGVALLIPWWASTGTALVGGGWAAWVKRAWVAARARAGWAAAVAWGRGLVGRKG